MRHKHGVCVWGVSFGSGVSGMIDGQHDRPACYLSCITQFALSSLLVRAQRGEQVLG